MLDRGRLHDLALQSYHNETERKKKDKMMSSPKVTIFLVCHACVCL